MKKYFTRPAAACLTALLCACSGAPRSANDPAGRPRPDWADGTSAAYPAQDYLTGVGSASSLSEASDKARGQIADFFLLQVTVKSKETSKENLRSQGGKKVDLMFQDVSQEVLANSAASVAGIQIADTWKDPRSLRFYALAVLDRRKAAQSLSDQIQDLDRETQELKDSLNRAADPFLKAKAAMSLLSSLETRRRLNSQLEVLSGQSVAGKFDETRLRSDAGEILSALSVSVLAQGDESGRLETGIVQGLGALGLEAAPSSAAAISDIVIVASATTQLLAIGDIPFQRALSSASVALKHGGDVFAQFNCSAYGNGGAAADAEDKSRAALSQAVAKELQKIFVNYFAGL